jgi:hypothetical protein
VKKRDTREIYCTLADIRTELSSVRGALSPLRRIADQLAALERAEQALTEAGRTYAEEAQARFLREVTAVQAERPPESIELTIAKQMADNARRVLLAMQWSGTNARFEACCPLCQAVIDTPHLPGCPLFQVIGPPRLADTEAL